MLTLVFCGWEVHIGTTVLGGLPYAKRIAPQILEKVQSL